MSSHLHGSQKRPRLNIIQGGRKPGHQAQPDLEFEAFARHERAICRDLAPVGPLELRLAIGISHTMWQLKKLREAEEGLFNAGVPANATQEEAGRANLATFLQYSAELEQLGREEDRLSKLEEGYWNHLFRAQRDRRQLESAARKQALITLRQALARGEEFRPGQTLEQNGFVFSISSLLAERDLLRLKWKQKAAQRRARLRKVS